MKLANRAWLTLLTLLLYFLLLRQSPLEEALAGSLGRLAGM